MKKQKRYLLKKVSDQSNGHISVIGSCFEKVANLLSFFPVGVHGIKGAVSVFCHIPFQYALKVSNVFDANNLSYSVKVKLVGKKVALFIDGIADRTSAENFKRKLYINMQEASRIGLKNEELYFLMAKDMEVHFSDCKNLGQVVNTADFGAGYLLEIAAKGKKQTIFYPFHKDYIKVIDFTKNVIIANEKIKDFL